MKPPVKETSFKDKIIRLSRENWKHIVSNDTAKITRIRKKALEKFVDLGIPDKTVEEWRNTNLDNALALNYNHVFRPTRKITNIENIFKCDVPHLNTLLLSLLNGWHVFIEDPLKTLPDGVIVGSFAHAIKQYPEIIEKLFKLFSRRENFCL